LVFFKDAKFQKHVIEEMTDTDNGTPGTLGTYKVLIMLLKRIPILVLAAILLTKAISAGPSSITTLKMIDIGISRSKISTMQAVLIPFHLIVPWLIAKRITGPRPLTLFLVAFPYGIFMHCVFAVILWRTPDWRLADGTYPAIVYIVWTVASIFNSFSMIGGLAFFGFVCQVADPLIGGTYVTLMTTLMNLGAMWPSTAAQAINDGITWKYCYGNATEILAKCDLKEQIPKCADLGGRCEIAIDGYYILVAASTFIGLIWLMVVYRPIRWLQKIPRSQWRINSKHHHHLVLDQQQEQKKENGF